MIVLVLINKRVSIFVGYSMSCTLDNTLALPSFGGSS
jgi:subtilase family serine protease